VLKDQRGRFIVLCPETDKASADLLAKRITHAITEKTDLQVLFGVSSFPEEALTFDDLLHTARERLVRSVELSEDNPIVLEITSK
jgi:GGDEF domain-containing protein